MTTENVKAEPLVKEVILDASTDKVWAAITDEHKMREWYFNVDAFKPVVGFEFSFTAGGPDKKYVHLCKVTEVEAGKKLTHSWRYEGNDGNSHVSWELFPQGDKTRLVLTHTGLETFFGAGSDFKRESFNQGWTAILGTNLPKYLAKQ